jgi:putative ABC transport system permease protein
MYIFKNAWKNVTRNRGRNILIGTIILVISAASCIALAIMNTSKTLIESYENKYDITATIEVNRQNMMQNFNPSSSDSKDNLVDKFSSINNLTISEVKKYGNSKYVSSYYYTESIGLDGSSIDPATTTKSSSNDKSDKQMPDGMNGGPNASTTDFKLVGYSSLDAMTEFIKGSYTITSGEVSEKDNTCVINKELATLNNINVGDTIKLTDDDGNIYKLTVSGIFTETSDSSNGMNMFSNSANNIITTSSTVEKITSSNTNLTSTIAPTFVLKNKNVIDDFKQELYDKGLNEYLTVSTNLDQIDQSTSTVSNVKSFATTFLIIVLIIGGIVLLVINAINIRERKYEIGVMRTIGMKKSTLTLEFMIELLMVSFVALVLGAAIGATLSVPVSNKLLSSEIASSNEQKNDISKNFGQMPSGTPPNDNNTTSNSDSSTTTTKAAVTHDFSKISGVSKLQAYSSIDAAVDFKVLAELLAIGLGLTILSGLASMIAIQRFSPLTILKERS